jgi:hypothetical protein
MLYVDPNSIRRLTTEQSEARRRERSEDLRYGSLPPPIYITCKPPARVYRIIRVTHGVCKHSRYSEILLAGARGFYLFVGEGFPH